MRLDQTAGGGVPVPAVVQAQVFFSTFRPRMYLRDEIMEVRRLLRELQKTLISLAARNQDAVMPGYTHLQRAQPVLFGHHLLAYYEMLKRDRERLPGCRKRVNVLPLGAAVEVDAIVELK